MADAPSAHFHIGNWIDAFDDCGAQFPVVVDLDRALVSPDVAVFSEDRRHRYLLTRGITGPVTPDVGVIMLNPSTANACLDDPTIRRVRAFADRLHRERGGRVPLRLAIANLYGLRSTDPKGLVTSIDPFGPNNGAALTWVAANSRLLLVAWGASLPVPAAACQPVQTVQRLVAEYRSSPRWKGTTFCLGRTKSGQPRHPLYLAADTTFEPWG